MPKASGRVRYILCFVIPADQIKMSKEKKRKTILFSKQVQKGDQVIDIYLEKC